MNELHSTLEKYGFTTVSRDIYFDETGTLSAFQASYHRLPKESSHGGRYRAYARYELIDGKLSKVDSQEYAQSKKYNDEDGGTIRVFPPMESLVL